MVIVAVMVIDWKAIVLLVAMKMVFMVTFMEEGIDFIVKVMVEKIDVMAVMLHMISYDKSANGPMSLDTTMIWKAVVVEVPLQIINRMRL